MSVIDNLSDVSSSDAEEPVTSSSLPLNVPKSTTSFKCSEFIAKRIKTKPRKKRKTIICDDPEIVRYWNRRYDLFERFDSGIQLDRESWFSVTPECIARRQARVCAGDLVIDAFAGVGGNSIQFATTCGLVLSIEHNWSRIQLLKHNANIYGVSSRIMAVCGDVERILRSLRLGNPAQSPVENKENSKEPTEVLSLSKVSVPLTKKIGEPTFPIVFMSPPWGGPGYTGVVLPPGSNSWNTRKRRKWFTTSMDAVEPTKNLEELSGLQAAVDVAKHAGLRMLLYLPRSSSVGQMLCLGWPSKTCDCTTCNVTQPVTIEQYTVRGRPVAVGVYIGEFDLEYV